MYWMQEVSPDPKGTCVRLASLGISFTSGRLQQLALADLHTCADGIIAINLLRTPRAVQPYPLACRLPMLGDLV